jgi:DNA-binding PadR family transcriptional regulator
MRTRRHRHDADSPPLKPALFLLLVCLGRGDRHGYALRKEVAERSGGRVRLGPATLYRSIEALLDAGLIEESARRPSPELDDERRRYYRITGRGRRTLAVETRRLEELAAAARAVIPDRVKA